jgi:hypothetical protein
MNNSINVVEKEPKEYTTWTFDTCASEYIICLKSIFTNFTKEKIILRHENNSIYEFEGKETYEGNLNEFNFKLKDIFYSNHINKILSSRIKLIQEGMINKIIPNKAYLTLNLNKHKQEKIIGKFETDNNNII